MYSYLNVDRGFLQRGLNAINYAKISIDTLWSAVIFKLAVFPVPTKTLVCSMTCDLCQPTKFKGYIRVFIYVGAGYLIHHFHALKLFRMTCRRFRTRSYTIREVPSLRKHRDPSCTLIIPILSLHNNSKWSK